MCRHPQIGKAAIKREEGTAPTSWLALFGWEKKTASKCSISAFSAKTSYKKNTFDIINSSHAKPGPEVIELFSCSTQLVMKFILLIKVKMPTNCWHFNIYEHDKYNI